MILSLNEIWKIVEKPFIAKSNTGWFVMITSDPSIQQNNYNGNTYGKIDKNLDILYLKTKSQKISSATVRQWKFIEIVKSDNH